MQGPPKELQHAQTLNRILIKQSSGLDQSNNASNLQNKQYRTVTQQDQTENSNDCIVKATEEGPNMQVLSTQTKEAQIPR